MKSYIKYTLLIIIIIVNVVYIFNYNRNIKNNIKIVKYIILTFFKIFEISILSL